MTVNGYEVSFCSDEDIPELDRGSVVVQLCKDMKATELYALKW